MGEASSLEEFFRLAEMDQYRVTYGPKSVKLALEQMVIKTLFISDKLFRAKNAETRKYYVDMYNKAKKDGVEIVQFGSMTPNGNRLNGMTGIAAILRMAMPDLDDLLDSESDEGDIDSDDESQVNEVGGAISDKMSEMSSPSPKLKEEKKDQGSEDQSSNADMSFGGKMEDFEFDDLDDVFGEVDYDDSNEVDLEEMMKPQ